MNQTMVIGNVEIPCYYICLFAAFLISVSVMAHDFRKKHLRGNAWMYLSLMGLVLGVVGAKLFFFLAELHLQYPIYGMSGLLRTEPGEFAFTGALLGVLAAAWITARCTREKMQTVLDAAAPAAMLLIALARFSEYFTNINTGAYLDNASFHFFPLAVVNQYGEWYAAVFMLEGMIALVIFRMLKNRRFPKKIHACDAALLLFALSQIFCESLRKDSIRWGFVRVQQISCVAIVLWIAAKNAVKLRNHGTPVWRLLEQTGIFLACIALCIGVEFALDKTDIPSYISYSVMAAALFGMGVDAFGQMKHAGA